MQASDPAGLLLSRQNRDGGWGYQGQVSWAEPTALALLALHAVGTPNQVLARGVSFLRSLQRADGGCAPQPNVSESNWVTALCVLTQKRLGGQPDSRSVEWLLRKAGVETDWLVRLRRVLMFQKAAYREDVPGWPWYPDAASWIQPTAITVLALQAAKPDEPRIAAGREFLLSRRCNDGGWNHGSSRALGYEADSYPETTGMTLLALHGIQRERIAISLEKAKQHLQTCRSSEAASWLRLGLSAHAVKMPLPDVRPPRSVMEMSLALLAEAAEAGRNEFLS